MIKSPLCPENRVRYIHDLHRSKARFTGKSSQKPEMLFPAVSIGKGVVFYVVVLSWR